MTARSITVWLLALASVCLVMGCGTSANVGERIKTQNDLKQIALTYLTYETNTGKPPSKLEDLATLKTDNPQAYQAIQDGKYVVVWDASTARNQADGLSNVILVYSTNADAKGTRPVAMMDGASKLVDAQEFDKTPKAKTGK
ncbi:MAG: hypothetical protein K2R98_20550 [Gemmataceae bacterium]|nr:hypothetical protein [Gemmataceae bacterium]